MHFIQRAHTYLQVYVPSYFLSSNLLTSWWINAKGKIVPVNAMKKCRGAEVQLHPFLTSALDGGMWSTSCPGYITPSKEPPYSWHRTLGGPRSQFGPFWRREHVLPLPGFEPRTTQSFASRYTIHSVPAAGGVM